MNPEYWSRRWEKGETGWHQSEVEPLLIKYFSELNPTRVMVPLCGKSLDLVWLEKQGHEVIGIELSSLACRSFFSERGVSPEVSQSGKFTVFKSGKLKLFNGNIFDLTVEDLGQIGAVYDRAALIALPPELRIQYAGQMIRLLEKSKDQKEFQMIQIVLQRTPEDSEGPPFSVSEAELRKLYGSVFSLESLGCETVEMVNGKTSQTQECCYRLSWS